MAKPRKQGKPKAKDKGVSNLKEAVVLIPLTYNDGTQVPQNTLESIREEIFVAFQGWTIEGTVKGAYRMRTGQKRVENLQKISIVLDQTQIPELEAMIARWAARLGQETMLVKIADFIVKFISPEPEEEES
jgi:hypothetical protein